LQSGLDVALTVADPAFGAISPSRCGGLDPYWSEFRPIVRRGRRLGARLGIGFNRLDLILRAQPDDASFDALLENYGEQTAAYQNTNVPLGMLMALDLTKDQSVGQHISALYRAAVGDFSRTAFAAARWW
jgi:hypothetical protein